MSDVLLKKRPVSKTGILIRKPDADVFAAFIDPAITTRFWFTKSSGLLEVGKSTTWEWEMYGVSTTVIPKAIEPNKRIVIEWDGYTGRTTVEWKFASLGPRKTFVSVTESGWTGNSDQLIKHVTNSTEGFAWTLAGLKAWLEHKLQLNVVADRFPNGPQDPSPEQQVDSIRATLLRHAVRFQRANDRDTDRKRAL